MTYTIRLPFATPSQNQWDRYHWGRRAKWMKIASEWLMVRLGELGVSREANSNRKMRVVIRRYSSGQLDYANLVGGCKGLVDCLRYAGILVDDNPMWLEDIYEQAPAPRGEGRTEIEVSDAAASTTTTESDRRRPEQLGLLSGPQAGLL